MYFQNGVRVHGSKAFINCTKHALKEKSENKRKENDKNIAAICNAQITFLPLMNLFKERKKTKDHNPD